MLSFYLEEGYKTIENNTKWTREAIDEFLKENGGLIHMALRPYLGLNEYEDLVQEAYIGW